VDGRNGLAVQALARQADNQRPTTDNRQRKAVGMVLRVRAWGGRIGGGICGFICIDV